MQSPALLCLLPQTHLLQPYTGRMTPHCVLGGKGLWVCKAWPWTEGAQREQLRLCSPPAWVAPLWEKCYGCAFHPQPKIISELQGAEGLGGEGIGISLLRLQLIMRNAFLPSPLPPILPPPLPTAGPGLLQETHSVKPRPALLCFPYRQTVCRLK